MAQLFMQTLPHQKTDSPPENYTHVEGAIFI